MDDYPTTPATARAIIDVAEERFRQDAKWGQQNHPDGTGTPGDEYQALRARAVCESAFAAGDGTWRHILTEEFREAMAEDNVANLREELVQLAAVAVAWVEAIDRRAS